MRLPFVTGVRREKESIIKNSRDIIHFLAVELGERTIRKYDNLQKARRYISDRFIESGVRPVEEKYIADGYEVSNIIAEIKGTEHPEKIILVGAHYDTIEDTPGADDNASGIAALLEVFRLLAGLQFKKTLRCVAFTLEEPPFFTTELMGSMVNARNCKKKREKIECMITFEMVGYGHRRCRQDYPINHNHRDFPPCGDYISVISLPSYSEYVYLLKKIYNGRAKNKIYEYIGPASVPGMDLSDHGSFIKSGFPAVMISDTGFYRNKNYHTPGDTFDTINFKFLTETIYDSSRTIGELLDRETLIAKHHS